MKQLNIKGKTFNYLKVIEKINNVSLGGVSWKCKCICGNFRIVKATHLKNNITRSCGCMSYKINIHSNKKYGEKEASYRAKASNYKAMAKHRNINWNLTIEECVKLLKSDCTYCGSKPKNNYNVISKNRIKKDKKYNNILKKENYDIKYNGIDRKNNLKGYTIENSTTCCSICNTAKLNMSLEDFKNWIEKLISNYNNWKNIF